MTGRGDTNTDTARLTAGSQNQIFPLIYSDPNKKNVFSQRFSSFPVSTLTHMFGQGSILKNFNAHITAGSAVYKQMSFETLPRKCNLQTCSVNPGQESSSYI